MVPTWILLPLGRDFFRLRSLSISVTEKFIPKRRGKKESEKPFRPSNSNRISLKSSSDVSMLDSLLISLKQYSNQSQLSKAFDILSHIQLQFRGSMPHDLIVHGISTLLLSCTRLKSLSPGKQLHGHVILLGFDQHYLLLPKLVNFYASLNLLFEAHAIIENSITLQPLPWNILINHDVKNGQYDNALLVYKQMLNRGIQPDNFTYPSVLKACAEKLDFEFGVEVHKSISTHSEWSLYVQNALVSMYGKFGKVEIARHLFDSMIERDAVSFNSMISGYGSKGMWKEAFEVFEKMRMESIEVNIITWNTIVGGFLRVGNYGRALELLSQMRASGVCLDSVAVLIGLGACSHTGFIRCGMEFHSYAIRFCYDKLHNVQNALITMYARCKDLGRAYSLFQLIESKSIISWNSMLSGYTHMDRAEEASFLFREMLNSRITPNYVTIASILPLCARVANLQHGKEFHCYLIRQEGFSEYLLLWNALVDMYARSGKVLLAKRVFDLLSRRDEVTYTSLIAGFGVQGEGRIALQLFDEMIKYQIKPDHITMVAVLSACSHSGLVSGGQTLFAEMQSVYGISPRLEHYACMADLFGRAGLLEKAKDLITRMPCRPTSAMWATLIGACHIHENAEIGEWAAEKLLEMRPENSGYYVLIANMYAAAGCWSKLAKVRILMRDWGVSKAPGCAWIDCGSEFVSFVVGDMSNPHVGEIYVVLDGLTELLKDDGNDFLKDFCFDDEE